MQIVLTIFILALSIQGIYNYIRIKNLEKRTEQTFVEVEKLLNIANRRLSEWK